MQSVPRRRGRPPSGGREAILAATVDLLRERGAAKFTTREVAKRAGVSEGSIFYHFNDRFGLLIAVITEGLSVLKVFPDPSETDMPGMLEGYSLTIEQLVTNGLVVLLAAQSDPELRTALAAFVTENRIGPRRGIETVAAYLAEGQKAGVVRADVDPTAVAFMLVGSVFYTVALPELFSEEYAAGLPDIKAVSDTMATLLAP